VKAVPPTVAVAGDREVMEGAKLLTLNAELPEVPPPGAGFDTVTWAVPAVAISVAGIAADSCVALANVVVRADPFQLTKEPLMNPLPFTVRVKAVPPTVAVDGDREVMEGAKLLTLNAELPEVPPPGAGFDTVTWAVPVAAISVAGMAAFNCVAPTNVVLRADPFQSTTELLMNPLPFTVRVKAVPPTVAVAGDREVMEGTGLEVWTLMTPPVPETIAAVPSDKAPCVPPIDMGTDEPPVEEVSVAVTTATVPLPIVLEFIPAARHVVDPVVALQVSGLLAAVRAGPAATLREATVPGE